MNKEKIIEKIIANLCDGKNDDYKIFIKKIINSMGEDNKWTNLSELEDVISKLRKDLDES
tara:strand:- start:979 stop:1158 length:180 start_codon:yes stop_codon:yes gene_type:complete